MTTKLQFKRMLEDVVDTYDDNKDLLILAESCLNLHLRSTLDEDELVEIVAEIYNLGREY